MEINNYQNQWEDKAPLMPRELPTLPDDWHSKCEQIIPIVRSVFNHGADSRLYFLDDIPGPCTIELIPGEELIQFNEAELITACVYEIVCDMAQNDPSFLPGYKRPLSRDIVAGLLDQIFDRTS